VYDKKVRPAKVGRSYPKDSWEMKKITVILIF